MNFKYPLLLSFSFLIANEISANSNDSIKRYVMDEVTVTGIRGESDINRTPYSVSIVNREDIDISHNNSFMPLLSKLVPGFFSTSRGVMGYGVSTGAAGGMTIRGIGGAPTTGVLMLIDGQPQFMGLMGHPIADTFQSMMAESVEVLRGPASVIYGSNAMGGVVNLITRKEKINGIFNDLNLSYGSYNTIQAEYSNRINKGAFSSVVALNYGGTDGHRDNMDFDQYGGYAKVGYRISDIWNIDGDVNVTQFKASNPGTLLQPLNDNDSRITRGMASFSVRNSHQLSSGALSLFYDWGHHRINDGYENGEKPLDYRFRSDDMMFGASLYQTADILSATRLTMGVDYRYFGGVAKNYMLATGTENITADEHINNVAGYVDIEQSLGENLSFELGARADHHSQVGTEFVPQAGMSWQITGASSLKATARKGYRNPTIKELYMFQSRNPELKSERLWNYDISYSQSLFQRRLRYELSAYYINGENMIQVDYSSGKPLNINTGKVENWGLEADVSFNITNSLSFISNYSWINMKNPVLAAPEHKFYAGVFYEINGWNVSTDIQYVHGLYTSISKDSKTKENYLLWNICTDYRVNRHLLLFLKGENLLNREYEINYGYPMPGATVSGGVRLSF